MITPNGTIYESAIGNETEYDTGQNESDNVYDYGYGYGHGFIYSDTGYTHDIYYYQSFDFEKPLFLYFWTILICLTTIANVLIISVLVRKNMRTSTNLILTVIACTDSLTGLVTLPLAYIYSGEGSSGVLHRVEMTASLCKVFMFLRYFASRGFHTMSNWLTVLLAFERMVLVRYPFKANLYFNIKRTSYMIAVIVVLAPCLHLYHAIEAHIKSVYNAVTLKNEYQCVWNLEEPCKGDCVYMWSVFHLMHFIPCILLLMLSVLMMHSLSSSKLLKYTLSQRAIKHREAENRRVLSVVIAVVIVFLVPEMMYGIYRLVEVTKHHAKAVGAEPLTLITKRRFRSTYEVLLVLSFHANFWIYLVMNRKFRRGVGALIFDLKCFKLCNLHRERTVSRSGSRSTSISTRGSSFSFRWWRSTTGTLKPSSSSHESSRQTVQLKVCTDNQEITDSKINWN